MLYCFRSQVFTWNTSYSARNQSILSWAAFFQMFIVLWMYNFVSPLNNWTLHKSRVFSPRLSLNQSWGLLHTKLQHTKANDEEHEHFHASNLYFYLSVFFFIQGHFCLQVYSNCLLGVKKVNTHSFCCTVVLQYDGRKKDGPGFNYFLTGNYLTKLVKWMKHLFISLIFVEFVI